MKKTLTQFALLCSIVLCAVSGWGQLGNLTQQYGAGAPAGNCPNKLTQYLDTPNGNLYTCPVPGAPWVLSGGGSGTPYSWFGNTMNPLTALVDPTTIVDADGSFIEFADDGISISNFNSDAIGVIFNGGLDSAFLSDIDGDGVDASTNGVTGILDLNDAVGDNCEMQTGSLACQFGSTVALSLSAAVSTLQDSDDDSFVADAGTASMNDNAADSISCHAQSCTTTTNLTSETVASGGVTVGSPAGGAKGANSLNVAGTIYQNNVPVNTSTANVTSSTMTSGVIPQATGAGAIANSNPQLDNGFTTANTLTYAGSGGIAAANISPGPTFSTPHSFWVPAYGWPTTSSVGSLSAANNQPSLFAFNLNVPSRVGSFSVEVVTGTATATCDVGIFGPVVSGATTAALAAHTGSFACATSTTLVTTPATLAAILQPGMYYEGWCTSIATTTLGAPATQVITLVNNAVINIMETDKLYGTDATDTCTAGVLPNSITIANISANIVTSSVPITVVITN